MHEELVYDVFVREILSKMFGVVDFRGNCISSDV